MTFTDLLVASTPIILLIVCLAWRGIPTLIEWRRERKYQVEWHRTFRDRVGDRGKAPCVGERGWLPAERDHSMRLIAVCAGQRIPCMVGQGSAGLR